MYREIPLGSYYEIDKVDSLRSALSALRLGRLQLPALLVDQMAQDDRVNGSLTTRLNGLVGTEIVFEPAKQNRECRQIADAAEEDWPRIWPSSEASALHRWGLMLSLGLGQLAWDTAGPRWVPQLRHWHPQWIWYDWVARVWRVTTFDAGIVDLPDIDKQPHGDGNWVVHQPHGHLGWTRALVRPLAIPWLVRTWAIRDAARFSEVHGQPIIKAMVPTGASDESKKKFEHDLRQLDASGQVTLEIDDAGRASYDVDLLEAVATGESFDRLITTCSTNIAVTLLGHNTTTDTSTGGGGVYAPQVGNMIRGDFKRADASTMERTAREQVLWHWAERNFGDGSLAPTPRYKTTTEGVDQASTTMLAQLAAALPQLLAAGADVEAILKRYDVPTTGKGPIAPVIPASAPPPKAPEKPTP